MLIEVVKKRKKKSWQQLRSVLKVPGTSCHYFQTDSLLGQKGEEETEPSPISTYSKL